MFGPYTRPVRFGPGVLRRVPRRRVVGLAASTVIALSAVLLASGGSLDSISGIRSRPVLDPDALAAAERFATAPCPPGPTTTLALVAGLAGSMRLDEVVPTPGLSSLATAADGTLLLGLRNGSVLRLGPSATTPELFVDLSEDTSTVTDQGLLGLAVDPASEQVYVLRTDRRGDLVLTSHPLGTEAASGPSAGRELLRIAEPSPLHNGGGLVFGPDGLLYVGVGDGGPLGDPYGNGADPDDLLGTVLRLDPTPSGDPEGSPAEVWATGLRNPFRLASGSDGSVWITDVGSNCFEEIDRLSPTQVGADLGWSRFEGFRPFLPSPLPDGRIPADAADGLVPPVAVYAHDGERCAVMGGSVYDGDLFPGLRGSLIVADFCTGELFAVSEDGGIRLLPVRAGTPVQVTTGPDGEIWIVDISSGVQRLGSSQ